MHLWKYFWAKILRDDCTLLFWRDFPFQHWFLTLFAASKKFQYWKKLAWIHIASTTTYVLGIYDHHFKPYGGKIFHVLRHPPHSTSGTRFFSLRKWQYLTIIVEKIEWAFYTYLLILTYVNVPFYHKKDAYGMYIYMY